MKLLNSQMKRPLCLFLFVAVLAACNKESINSIYGTWDFNNIQITKRNCVSLPSVGGSITYREDMGDWNSIACSGSMVFQQDGKVTFVSADGERVPALYSYNDKEHYIEFYQVANFCAVIDFSGTPETITIGPGVATGEVQTQYRIKIEKGVMTMTGKFWYTISDYSWWSYENAVATFKKK